MKKIKSQIFFTLNNVSLINIISSFLVGIFIALNISNDLLYLFFIIGFLGCFSTFSSFIYQLFKYLQEGHFVNFIYHYLEVFCFSLGFCMLGFWSTNLIFR